MDIGEYYQKFMDALKQDVHFAGKRIIENGTIHERRLESSFQAGSIGVMPHPADHMVPFHTHDYFELIYVYKGFCLNLIDQGEFRMEAGDFCLMNPAAYHTLRCPEPDGTIIYNILIGKAILLAPNFLLLSSNDLVADFFLRDMEKQSAEKNYIFFPHTGDSNRAALFCEQLIFEHFERTDALYQHSMLLFLFYSLLVELIRMYQDRNNHFIGKHSAQIRISDVIYYIGSHCDSATLSSTAEHFSYHPKHFSRLIRSATGQSFSELLLSIRMQRAKSMLELEDLPITAVMHKVGYQNYVAFCSQFKKSFGIAPADVRKHGQTNSG